VTAELMMESLQRVAGRHVIVFVSLRDPTLQQVVNQCPDRSILLAEAAVARNLLQERGQCLHGWRDWAFSAWMCRTARCLQVWSIVT
jgi:hypothetical protein